MRSSPRQPAPQRTSRNPYAEAYGPGGEAYREPPRDERRPPLPPPSYNGDDWFGPEVDRAERRARRRMLLIAGPVVTVMTVAAVGGLGYAVWPSAQQPLSGEAPRAAEQTPVAGSAPAAPGSSPAASRKPGVVQKGKGTYTVAAGGGRRVGTGGTLIRYTVRVENGLRQNPAAFAKAVDAILAAPRGWTRGGRWSFQRVTSGPVNFVITLASPVTSTSLCEAAHMDTGGQVNCSAPGDVIINLKRWLLLTPYYQGHADLYHALAVNHEVGHRLGFGHMSCPGEGKPAPVMMQQIYGLHGCVINGWPYTGAGRLITGPPVA